jgi:hypothetical protein
MTLVNLKRSQISRYIFKNFPKTIMSDILGKIEKRIPKKRCKRTSLLWWYCDWTN